MLDEIRVTQTKLYNDSLQRGNVNPGSPSTRGLPVLCISPLTSNSYMPRHAFISSAYFGIRVLRLLLLPYKRRLCPLSSYSMLVTFVHQPSQTIILHFANKRADLAP